MAIRRWTSSDNTDLWTHLNNLAIDAENEDDEIRDERRGERRTHTFASRSWGAGGSQSVTFTFARTYDVPPMVIVNIANSPGGQLSLRPDVLTVTTTQATVRVQNTTTAALTLSGDLDIRVEILPLHL